MAMIRIDNKFLKGEFISFPFFFLSIVPYLFLKEKTFIHNLSFAHLSIETYIKNGKNVFKFTN